MDETTQETTNSLKSTLWEKVEKGKWERQEIEIALGTHVLELAEKIRGPKNGKAETVVTHPPIHAQKLSGFQPPPHLAAILSEIQELPGCNGGGASSSIFSITISPRYAEFSFGEDEYGTLQINCEECGATYQRAPHKLEEKCRFCGGTKGIIC